MPACEASHYLQMWDTDAALKPRGFDAKATMRLQGLAGEPGGPATPVLTPACLFPLPVPTSSLPGPALFLPGPSWRAELLPCPFLHPPPPTLPTHPAPTRTPAADVAAVSSGGRANGRWKPDNQDSFLVQPAAAAAGTATAAAGTGEDAEAPATAAAIGVFDGHGRLGASASAIVRQAMAERLAAPQPGEAAAGGGPGGGAAGLLGGCFSAAEAALEASGRDFSKSGCTAVLALVDRDRCVCGGGGS